MTLRFAIPLLLTLLASCSVGPQKYQVEVNSLATDFERAGQTYVLTSGMEGTPISDQQFQEFALYLHRALQDQGFRAAQDQAKADLMISLSYGVSDPIVKQEHYRQPIWESTDAPYVYRAIPFGSRRDCPTSIGYYPAPRHRIVGYTQATRSTTVFNHHLDITAVTNQHIGSSAMALEQWTMKCSIKGDPRDDLRVSFPIMLAGARFHFGKSSGRIISFELEEDHPDVLALRGEPIP